MKLPQTSEEMEAEILLSSDKYQDLGDLRIRQLIKILPKVNSEVVIEGIIRVFENENRPTTRFRDQEFAGKVLECINPRSDRDLKEVLSRILKNWDKSVEQLAFWLRDNYGLEKLTTTFSNIALTDLEKDKLKTVKWWLQLDEASA